MSRIILRRYDQQYRKKETTTYGDENLVKFEVFLLNLLYPLFDAFGDAPRIFVQLMIHIVAHLQRQLAMEFLGAALADHRFHHAFPIALRVGAAGGAE